MLKIPFFKPTIDDEEVAAVVDAIRSGWLTTGPKVKAFEADFSRFVGAEHSVALNSATAALHLALEAVGIKRGDGVLVPTMTFAATAEVVRYFDAYPILVDCNLDDFNIDPEDADRKAAEANAKGVAVKAIIPVHFGGQAADMDRILLVARKHQLKVIEDAAHCCPAAYQRKSDMRWIAVGAEADIACYSFYANKCITTGEGGMACTNDSNYAERMRIMSLHGISKDAWKRFTAEGSWSYEIVAPGFKYNMTDIAAALGVCQLRKADRLRNERERVANAYSERLRGINGLVLPIARSDRRHSWHLYVVRIEAKKFGLSRTELIETMKQAGIGASVHWIPLHMHPYYRQTYGYVPADYPRAALLAEEVLSLPIYPTMNLAEIDYVCNCIKRASTC